MLIVMNIRRVLPHHSDSFCDWYIQFYFTQSGKCRSSIQSNCTGKCAQPTTGHFAAYLDDAEVKLMQQVLQRMLVGATESQDAAIKL